MAAGGFVGTKLLKDVHKLGEKSTPGEYRDWRSRVNQACEIFNVKHHLRGKVPKKVIVTPKNAKDEVVIGAYNNWKNCLTVQNYLLKCIEANKEATTKVFLDGMFDDPESVLRALDIMYAENKNVDRQ